MLFQESNASPLSIRKSNKLNEKQYCWIVIKALARQRRWNDIEKLITTKRLLIGPKMKSPIPYEKLVDILQKHGATPDVSVCLVLYSIIRLCICESYIPTLWCKNNQSPVLSEIIL